MLRTLIAVAALASTAACATITKGSNDTITVNTTPPGASCEIKQGPETIAFINPTPGSMVVSKSSNDLAVKCSKEGYQDTAGTLSSEIQAMTFGNILFGGVIGVAVDAASGAMNEYPPMISLTLQPTAFHSNEQRDLFFDSLRDQLKKDSDAAVAHIKKTCRGDDCARQLKAAEDARERQLEQIEERRLAANVVTS